MKIVFTIADAIHFVHAGGEVEKISSIVDIDPSSLPDEVKSYLEEKIREKRKGMNCYKSLSISILHEN